MVIIKCPITGKRYERHDMSYHDEDCPYCKEIEYDKFIFDYGG